MPDFIKTYIDSALYLMESKSLYVTVIPAHHWINQNKSNSHIDVISGLF
ncbi:hypothetical protein [Indibacter alkaliphilus]|nr:hypothetical protein [Indibacter alkaliphilus]